MSFALVSQEINSRDTMTQAAELGLLVVTHAGLDIGFPGVVRAAPSMALHALRELKNGRA